MLVSNNQLEEKTPPSTNPRTLNVSFVFGLSLSFFKIGLDHCQPPAIRTPSPTDTVVPFVLRSKVVMETSGAPPPRSQLKVELLLSNTKLWLASTLLINRPTPVRGCPANKLKPPPTRIAPSSCTTNELI